MSEEPPSESDTPPVSSKKTASKRRKIRVRKTLGRGPKLISPSDDIGDMDQINRSVRDMQLRLMQAWEAGALTPDQENEPTNRRARLQQTHTRLRSVQTRLTQILSQL